MRRLAVFSGSILLLVAIHVGVNGQDTGVKAPPKSSQPAPKASAPLQAKPPAGQAKDTPTKPAAAAPKDAPPKQPVAEQPVAAPLNSPDEDAIRLTGVSYVKAFNQHDAKAAADHFTKEAEYVDEHGTLTAGRAAIEKTLKDLFAKYPDCKFALQIDKVAVLASIAIEDGMTELSLSSTSDPAIVRYVAVHTKFEGKWLVASVREFPVMPQRQHRAQLRQLDWMLGDWVHEGNDAVATFSCQPVDNGNFLLRTFTIHIAGQEAMSGSQRIGWDAQASRFRAWIFDSDGGHSEGFWHRDGDSWVLKASGVTADGQSASSTSSYAFVNGHTMTFQTVDHEVGGIELPDGPKVTIVRHAPRPE